MTDKEHAEKLKAEGNALFSQQQWSQAAAKYTEALRVGGPNAILFNNRAACKLNLKDFLSALADAREATVLAPKYAKAHARMALAHDGLQAYWQSVPKWLDALNCLPKENVSPAELKLREQYEAGYQKSLALKKADEDPSKVLGGIQIIEPEDAIKLPVVEAQALVPQLKAKHEFNSSAFVLGSAYSEWLRGIEGLKIIKRIGEAADGVAMVGQKGVIESLTNAILRDERVFHISDRSFLIQYNDQAVFELARYDGWGNNEGVETIMKEATERVAIRGWDNVRWALAITIRRWIMRGFIDSALLKNEVSYAQFLGQAVELIEKCREEWGHLPDDAHGSIFEPTFYRAVLNLELNAIQKRWCKGDYVKSAEEDLELFLEKANKIIELVKAAEPAPPLEQHDDPGFVLAHWNYVKSSALAIKGVYYAEKANLEENYKEQVGLYQDSVSAYMEAAAALPEDDEKHCFLLSRAVDNLWNAPPAPIGFWLDLLGQVKKTRPKMMQIWAKSVMALGGRDSIIDKSLGGKHDVEADLLGAIERGAATREHKMIWQAEDALQK